MSGLEGGTDGLPQGDKNQHHLAGAWEFSTGELGNFQPASTQKIQVIQRKSLAQQSETAPEA